ncbi:hypothetical protein D9M68_870620 [compost metagenome]
MHDVQVLCKYIVAGEVGKNTYTNPYDGRYSCGQTIEAIGHIRTITHCDDDEGDKYDI